MSDVSAAWLVEQIRSGSETAWRSLIEIYEGRLSAFVAGRIRDRHALEDIVQETFLGFLRSLPHFDSSRDLESYLFTIAAHKIRDHLRRQSRHPLALLDDLDQPESPREPAAGVRGPSSLLASAERLQGEEERLSTALAAILDEWRRAGDFRRIKCIELMLVAGWSNRDTAEFLGLAEQQAANYKFQLVERLSRKTKSTTPASN
jgi:RNA polymerase sigma-70 factor (ECF subfamily)